MLDHGDISTLLRTPPGSPRPPGRPHRSLGCGRLAQPVSMSAGKPSLRNSSCPPRAHTPSSSHARCPHGEREDGQEAGRDTKQRCSVRGRSHCGCGPTESSHPFCGAHSVSFPLSVLLGNGVRVGCWLTSGPPSAPRGGQGGTGCQCGRGVHLPMQVRPSECRAYFWWQPHRGPVSVSSQLCWQPPFP